jgi:hypothetical protein
MMTSLFDQVPAVIERVQREIVLARFIGKLAVDQGLAEVRQRVEAIVAPPDTTAAPTDARLPARERSRPSGPPPASPAVDVDSLALADYDHLPATAIVAKLDGLEPDELDAIEAYERSGRGRRTVLGKIERLREEPG